MRNRRLTNPFRRQSRRLFVLAGVVAGIGATVVPAGAAQAAGLGSMVSSLLGTTGSVVSSTTSSVSSTVTSTVTSTATTLSDVTSAVATEPAVSANARGCDTTASLSQPFAGWGDQNYYDLAPGGDFESGLAGWSASGGAELTAGSEPYAVTGSLGSYAMYLPSGASVQSPYFCVDPSDPTFRFFVRNESASADVNVSIVFKSVLGVTVVLPVGSASAAASWAPSPTMATESGLFGALNGGTEAVALRFTASGGPSEIDDVLVDPRCK
jgi:hypothetical protein